MMDSGSEAGMTKIFNNPVIPESPKGLSGICYKDTLRFRLGGRNEVTIE